MIDVLLERIARLEQRVATANPEGPVVQRDHIKGVRVRLGGTDDDPQLSPWIQPADRTGASRYLPQVGEQVQLISHAGDWSQSRAHPLTHTDAKPNPAKNADETVHHNRDGQRHAVEKGHVTDQADDKHSRFVGKDPGDTAGAGGNFPHELQRQLQGIRAQLTQHVNDIAGLHKATSQFRDIVQQVIPGVAAVQHLLNGDPGSLEQAAQEVLGQLESYVAKNFQQMVSKLTNGFLDNIEGLVSGFLQGGVEDLLGQVADLAAANGIDITDPMSVAMGAAQAAGAGQIAGALAAVEDMATAFAGTPAEAAFALLQGQLGGALGMAANVMAGLGDMTDAQRNITKGLTKHYRLGGY